MIARVLGEIASFIFAGLINDVLASTSTKTGFAPHIATATAVATGTSLTYTANVITVNNYTAAAAQAVTLPTATAGTKVVHFQTLDPANASLATLSFVCAGSDVFRTGSKVQSTAGAASTMDTSAADETTLTYTPVNAATNILTLGCYLYFTCDEAGTWEFAHDLAKYTTATAGTFAWS